jgi:hypothetical protein
MVQGGDKTDLPARTDARNRSSVLHRVAAFGLFRGRGNSYFLSFPVIDSCVRAR